MTIKTLIAPVMAFAIIFGTFSVPEYAEAKVRVKSYYKPSTYRYVAPHYRTSPNRTKLDNWSTKGNYNPYTGKIGTKSPYKFR
jgi:hypothetical protein